MLSLYNERCVFVWAASLNIQVQEHSLKGVAPVNSVVWDGLVQERFHASPRIKQLSSNFGEHGSVGVSSRVVATIRRWNGCLSLCFLGCVHSGVQGVDLFIPVILGSVPLVQERSGPTTRMLMLESCEAMSQCFVNGVQTVLAADFLY